MDDGVDERAPPKAAAEGGVGDFDAFFRANFARVARTMMLVGGADAGEEIAQEAFTRLYERWARMTSEDHARNFVFKVAVNLARSHHRKMRTARTLARAIVPVVEAADAPGRVDTRMAVFAALAELSPKQRACVALVDYAALTDRDAAEAVGIRPSTVRVHLARGRRRLRELLEEGEG